MLVESGQFKLFCLMRTNDRGKQWRTKNFCLRKKSYDYVSYIDLHLITEAAVLVVEIQFLIFFKIF